MTLGHPGADHPAERAEFAPGESDGAADLEAPPGEPGPAGSPAAAEATDDHVGEPTTTPGTPAKPERGRRRRGKPRLSFAQELPFLVLAALVLAILIKAFVVQAFYIPSGSMEQTLHGCPTCHGDRVMVNKLSYDFHGVHRGDIIVFNGKDNYHDQPPASSGGNPVSHALHKVADWVGLLPEGTDYIKRVIGLPGDHLHCCDKQGRLMVNGHSLNETYVFEDNHRPFDVVVPAGHVFAMGDHRSDSTDSRDVGAIPEKDIIGRAFVIIWPPSRWRWFSTPKTFQNWPDNTAAVGAAPVVLSGLTVFGANAVRRRRRRRHAAR